MANPGTNPRHAPSSHCCSPLCRFSPVRTWCAVEARVGLGRLLATSGMSASGQRAGCNRAGTLVIHENDATWGDLALRHLERRRDGAIGKQPFSTAQRQRIYLEPELIDQIMLHQRLKEICTAVHVQIRPWLVLEFADFFRNVSA